MAQSGIAQQSRTAAAALHRTRLVATVRTWRASAGVNRARREMARLVVARWQRKTCLIYLHDWRASITTARRQAADYRAQSWRATRLLRSNWTAWRDNAMLGRQQRALQLLAVTSWRSTSLTRSFVRWRSCAAVATAINAKLASAIAQLRGRSLQALVSHWRSTASASSTRRAKMAEVVARSAALRISKLFQRWVATAVRSKATQAKLRNAVTALQQRHLRAAFGGWLKAHQEISTARSTMRRAVAALTKRALTAMFSTWKSQWLRRRTKLANALAADTARRLSVKVGLDLLLADELACA